MSTDNKSVKCPKCKETFKVDDTVYTDIIKQVRDQQFNDELNQRLTQAQKEKDDAIKLAKVETENSAKDTIASLDRKIIELEANNKQQLAQEIAKKDNELAEKNAKLQAIESQAKLATNEAVSRIEKERDAIKSSLELQKAEQQVAISNALRQVEKERDSLRNTLQNKETEAQIQQSTIKAQHALELKAKEELLKHKEEQITSIRDFKQKQSTKMMGESLEQHCEVEFNKLRATAFQNAYFEKDNDASGGTKGDFIFRENDINSDEIISIMFEMKNESDQTATKKKNEDFFAKLDKDRNAKGCEYAVLVSMLEADNEFYNTGIVDVSYKYPKMFVIRPQFFIPIITLLRNAGVKSLQYKAELNIIKNQHIDITNFENKIEDFKTGFARNYDLASRQFKTAIDEIDKTMNHLQKTKDALMSSVNNLRLANTKAEDLSIKKLTYNNPTMKQKFNHLK